MTAQFDMLRAFVRNLLRHPITFALNNDHPFEWSLQGFGMLRCYLDPEKQFRLHIWDPARAAYEVSTLHNHPWDFTSVIISGEVADRTYLVREVDLATRNTHWRQRIQCGEGGGLCGGRQGVQVRPLQTNLYRNGATYGHVAETVHESIPSAGAVTLIRRHFHPDTEHADVLWPVDKVWVSAEPHPATKDEVEHFTRLALKEWT